MRQAYRGWDGELQPQEVCLQPLGFKQQDKFLRLTHCTYEKVHRHNMAMIRMISGLSICMSECTGLEDSRRGGGEYQDNSQLNRLSVEDKSPVLRAPSVTDLL